MVQTSEQQTSTGLSLVEKSISFLKEKNYPCELSKNLFCTKN